MIIFIFISSVLCSVLFFAANARLKTTNWYKNRFVDSQKFINGIPNGLDIANLGSSQPKYAFDYTDIGRRGMNMALAPQPFHYDYAVLRKYASHFNKNAVVLIPVCPFKYLVYEYEDDWTNYKYYPFLGKTDITGYSEWKKAMVLKYPLLWAKRGMFRLLKDVAPDTSMILTGNPMSCKQVDEDAVRRINGWKRQFGIKNMDDFSLSAKNMESIEKNIILVRDMLSFCHSKGLTPVFVLLPVTISLKHHFPEKYINEYVIGSIKRSMVDNELILDYFHDARYEDESLYINSFFFNAIGRKAFTKKILEDLNKIIS